MKIGKFISDLFNFDVLLGLISGPIISTLIMLLPLGVLVGLFEVLDPAFVAYEYVPEEILFIPWLIILLFISIINVRVAFLMKKLDITPSVYFLKSDKFYMRPEDRKEMDEYPGKLICNEFFTYIKKSMNDLSYTMPEHKDYGWTFLVDKDANSVIEVTFSFIGISENNPHMEEYEVSIDYLAPVNPFYRISFSPNPVYQEKISQYFRSFASSHGVELKTEDS